MNVPLFKTEIRNTIEWNTESERIQNLGKSAKAVGLGSTPRPYFLRNCAGAHQ